MFIVLGLVALIVAARAPEEKQELAARLFQGGIMSLGFGLTIALLFWLYRKLTG